MTTKTAGFNVDFGYLKQISGQFQVTNKLCNTELCEPLMLPVFEDPVDQDCRQLSSIIITFSWLLQFCATDDF